MVEIEPKKARKRRHPRRPHLSPPGLPPRWGEGVAPPPTPQYPTPHVSPEATSVEDSQRPRRAAGRYLQRHHSSTVNNSFGSKEAKLVMIPKRAKQNLLAIIDLFLRFLSWPFLRSTVGFFIRNQDMTSFSFKHIQTSFIKVYEYLNCQ